MAMTLNSTGSIFATHTSSSAAGLISYLEEDDNNLKVIALKRLYAVIDLYWAEICESLPTIEALSEDETFAAADLAAAVASKCFYHLQEYNDALRLALSAGSYLDISAKNEYIETIITKCIDEYKSLRNAQLADDKVVIDVRMEAIIEKMFARCYADQCFEQALGVALDTHRIDKVDEVVSMALKAGKEGILGYAFSLCQSARKVTPRDFRLSVIQILVQGYATLADPDYTNVATGLMYLNKPEEVAKTLDTLLKDGIQKNREAGSGGVSRADLQDRSLLLAYQIAFDLLETENQGFVLKVVSSLLEIAAGGIGIGAPTPSAQPSPFQEAYTHRIAQIQRILTQNLDVDLTVHFLHAQCQADKGHLVDIKNSLETTNRISSVLHSSLIVAHGFLYAGTTIDTFLRENLEWLGRAKNWGKFTTVGCIGGVHRGQVGGSMTLLAPYLPQGGVSSSPYSEGGALYALGLIHANKGGGGGGSSGGGDSATITYLTQALQGAGGGEVVQQGACLGVGLAGMATCSEELFEVLRVVLFNDSAVAGEGAAWGMGLVMLGGSDSPLCASVLPDLLNYLHDTQHEKIIRALSLAIAMTVYGKEEGGDVIIEQLCGDRDPLVRYGGMYAMALAYVATGENKIVRKLLHVAVSDVSDDVRRAAVVCIGFVMLSSPLAIPPLVALLAESFNPHVRYGVCMCIGVGCAGSASAGAIDILAPLLEDSVDFVRGGALMALAMVLQQTSEARTPVVKKFREYLHTTITDKHTPVLAKSGAILAGGILDAGGGNVCINLCTKGGGGRMGGVIGMVMFLQHWYWYPLLPCLTLAFVPTMVVGLNAQFNMPLNFTLTCNAPPSMFAYPPKAEEKKGEDKKVVATAVLSTTAKAKVREMRKEARKGKGGLGASTDKMDVAGDGSGIPLERVHSHLSTTSYLSLDTEKGKGDVGDAVAKTKKAKEPTSFLLNNPSRLVPAQVRFVSIGGVGAADEGRYVPVRGGRAPPSGFVMLVDTDLDAPEEVVKVDKSALGQEEDAPPFEPFEWDPNEE